MSKDIEIDFDKLDKQISQFKEDSDKTPIKPDENPFLSEFQKKSTVHKWFKTDERGNAIGEDGRILNESEKDKRQYLPQSFGISIHEVIKSQKGSIFFKGTVWYEKHKRQEILFPFQSMFTQIKKETGIDSKVSLRNISDKDLEDMKEKLEGKLMWVDYSGKVIDKEHPNGFHSCYIQFKQ